MELHDIGRLPIPGENPAGEDIRSDSAYAELTEQIDKLSSPTAASPPDWQRVRDLAQQILSQKSKHMLVAVFFCHAQLMLRGLRGFGMGVGILKDILDAFWPSLYPVIGKAAARENALIWWRDRAISEISRLPREAWNTTDRQRLLDDLSSLDDFFKTHLANPPALRSLTEAVDAAISAPLPVVATPPPILTEAPAGGIFPAPTTDERDPAKLLSAGLDLLSRARMACENAGNSSLLAVRLNRVAAWFPIEDLPPNENGRTMIPPPDSQVITAIMTLGETGAYADLLAAAEARLREFVFWLDLNRWAALAAGELGLSAIHDGIAMDTAAFLRRLPELEGLEFSDGTPFADEESRVWLRDLRRNGSSNQENRPSLDPDAAQLSEFFQQAAKKLKANKMSALLQEFKEQRRRVSGLRQQLLWDQELCRLLLRTKSSRMLIPYLAGMLEAVKQHHIESWEPELAAQTFEIALKAVKSMGGAENGAAPLKHLLEEAIRGLSILDPVRALDYL